MRVAIKDIKDTQCIIKIYKRSEEVVRQREASHKPNCRIGSLFNYPDGDHRDEAARLALDSIVHS